VSAPANPAQPELYPQHQKNHSRWIQQKALGVVKQQDAAAQINKRLQLITPKWQSPWSPKFNTIWAAAFIRAYNPNYSANKNQCNT
jgi:hypothetical protein